MRKRKDSSPRLPNSKCLVLFATVFLLTLVFFIPKASAATPPPTKLIKHPPVIAQIKPNTIKVNKLAPIQFRKFAFQELRHPKTKAVIAPTDMITLKSGKKITGQQLLDEINRLEGEYNKFGYSLRRTDRKPILSNETIMKRDLHNSQHRNSVLKYQPVDKARQKVYDFGAMHNAHLNNVKLMPQRAQIIQAVGPQLVASLATKPVDENKSYDDTWGDRDYFAAGVHGELHLHADKDKIKTSAGGWASATVFDHDWKVVTIDGRTEGPAGKSGGDMHAYLKVTVLGDDLFTPVDKTGPAPLPLLEDDQNIGVDESVKIPVVDLGPFSVNVTLGFQGKAGIRYGMYLDPASIQAKFMPYIETSAYGQAGLNVWLIVDFEAGVGAKLTLLNDYLELGTAIGIGFDQPQPYFFWEYWGTNTIETLSGNVYVYLTIDYYIDSDTWKWNVYSWDGFRYDGDVIKRQRFTQPLSGGASTEVAPTGSTTGGDDWKVTVWKDSWSKGKSKDYYIFPGQCQTLQRTFKDIDMNDMITSVHVGSQVNVWLFEHDSYDGKQLPLTDSVGNLSQYKFNDMASSMIVYPKSMVNPLGVWLIGNHATFYPVTQCNKSGTVEEYPHVVHNDDATIVRIPPIDHINWGSVVVTVWKDANFKGQSATYTATSSGGEFSLPKGLKGEVSSLKIVVNGRPGGRP